MTGKLIASLSAGALGIALFGGMGVSATTQAQGTQKQPPKQSPPPASAPADKNKPDSPAPQGEAAPPPVSAEEDAAFKAIQDAPASDTAKKQQLAEDFLQKYSQSRYRTAIYQNLISVYFSTQQIPKMVAIGEKEIELNPNDAAVLALLGQTLARSYNDKAPDAEKQLTKAEDYSKRAIEITPTLTKPDTVSDEAFTTAKNGTLVMAHSGLGLVHIRRGRFDQAIPELEQSIKADTHPEGADPVNYYLLGIADDKTSHYDAAVEAFSKCAAIPSNLQPTCKNNAEESKKHGATQLSAPK
jgi:tetratricopeptide (TPR) repeat protein